MPKLSRTIAFAAGLLLAHVPAFAEEGERPASPSLSFYGVSGNVVVPSGGEAVPALSARGLILGDPSQWFDERPSAWMARAKAQGQIGAMDDGDKSLGLGYGQVHAGVGRFEGKNLYYMPFVNYDVDGAVRDGDPRIIQSVVGGAELGARLSRGKTVVFAGVNSGMGGLWIGDGNEVRETRWVEEGQEQVDRYSATRWSSRSGLAVGASLTGRVGGDHQAGAVLFDGSGAVLPGLGKRFDAAVDVNLTDHIQLGAGLRVSQAEAVSSERGDVVVAQPFVRLTLSEHGGGGWRKAKVDSGSSDW